MRKWYEEKYINRRDWILEHLELLGLDASELLIVMLIDFMNEYHEDISFEVLQKKSGLSMEDTNKVIASLCGKHYLDIMASASTVRFCLDGLFETNVAREVRILDNSLISLVETEFGRTLSSMEMQKISDWNRDYEKKLILYAIREASVNHRLSVPQIDKILSDWSAHGVTVEQIEEGRGIWKE